VQEITNVATVYFDNKDYDLLRYILLIRRTHILFRLRAYEYYDRPPEPISEYWMEVKIRNADRRRKKRFRLKRSTLQNFLDGRDIMEKVVEENREEADAETIGKLYAEMRETYFTWGLRPALFVNYKRIAFQSRSERLSLDWDIQYYPADDNLYGRDSWKYPVETSAGKAKQIVMELKYPQGTLPSWIANLETNFPVVERNYVKPVDGMGFLFAGPLKDHPEAQSFLRMIKAYNAETQPLG
jgi:VTC domain-containing protein